MTQEKKLQNETFKIKRPENFCLSQIFDCGQCFRFDKADETGNIYEGVAFSKYLKVAQDEENLYFYGCTKDDFENIWKNFFDWDRKYSDIISAFSDDEALSRAAKFSSGIRILKQDKWETLCSFIISQNNNIPRIKGIIKNMSQKFGTPFTDPFGETRYAFPTAESLYNVGEDEIFALKTGFRAKYIYDAAKKVTTGEIDLDEISQMNLTDAAMSLERIKGVGPKVTACTLLFGFSKYDAFPIDVWVKKILAKYYSECPSCHFSGEYAGIAQQYLFYYERCQSGVLI